MQLAYVKLVGTFAFTGASCEDTVGVGVVFFGPLSVLRVDAGEPNPEGFPPALGALSLPPCGWSYPIALESTGAGLLPWVIDASSTGQIVVETATTDVMTLVD